VPCRHQGRYQPEGHGASFIIVPGIEQQDEADLEPGIFTDWQ